MVRELLVTLWLLTALGAPALGQVATTSDSLPPIGARIRVLAPRLGGTWREGMLNQLRVRTLCYSILIFKWTPSRRIEAMLTIGDLRALQVHQHAGRATLWDPEGEATADVTGWTEVPLELLRRAQSCPPGPDSVARHGAQT